jgi:hypothetical protein
MTNSTWNPTLERRATYVSAFQLIFDIDQGGIIAGVLALACRYVLSELIAVHASALYFSSRWELPVLLSQTPSSKENEIGRRQA